MTVPNTIVCLKVVPRPEEVRIDPEALTLDRVNVRSVINPADMHALEAALALKDRYGGTIRLLAMGPPLFEGYLRLALAMGADEAYLMSDRALGGADTLATSYALAAGIRKIGESTGDYHLVLCGEESSDGATGQVPPGIAEWLGVPQITYATELALVDSRWRLRATRELRGGHEVLVSSLPAVVSVKMRTNEPRFLDMGRRAWAADAPITVWSAADLGVDAEMIGLPGSPTVVAGTHEAPQRERRRELIEGTPEEIARTLVSRIRPYLETAPSNGHRPSVRLAPGAGTPEAGEPAGSSAAAAALVSDTSDVREIGQRPGRAAVSTAPPRTEDGQPVDAEWEGRAELLDSDGAVVAQVLAELWKQAPAGRGAQWGGHIRTELGGGHLPLAGDYTLRLESGGAATVSQRSAVKSYRRDELNGEEVDVRGKGEPPF